ncbi:hemerythrin HHE cation binding domain-containing protein [Kribbella voronezhensis]|uniref:Hemerythrin HHE cation binding domain-containing protein n=2 Tax=Kribbella voronezhensis TaxID=2512212 RepID=A0A4R7TGC5_9ACTN|nr:hemerythrin HHE cation binding domain-containing protein [Kribbella voronezhensis]
MNRAIHAAFRRDLKRFVDALSAFPAGDRKRAEQLATAWANFDDQLVYHHEGEHEIAWPALEAVGVSRELLTQMDAEHETMAAALASARSAMGTLRSTASADDAQAALAAMRELQTVTVRHLDHEEAEIEPVYLAKKDSPEIKAMGRKFGQVSPARGGRFFAWAIDGAGPEEQAALADTIPAPVFAIINGVFGRSYRKNVAPVWHG